MINVGSNDLQKLYLAYFGRPGDPSCMKYCLLHPNASITLRAISKELSIQDEYTKIFLLINLLILRSTSFI